MNTESSDCVIADEQSTKQLVNKAYLAGGKEVLVRAKARYNSGFAEYEDLFREGMRFSTDEATRYFLKALTRVIYVRALTEELRENRIDVFSSVESQAQTVRN